MSEEEDNDTEEEDSPSSESEYLDEDENMVSLDIESFVEGNKMTIDATVEICGKMLHMTRVVREIFNEFWNW